jgi:UDP-sugar transporter A1/2/3
MAVNLKWVSLFVLVFQNSFLALILRYSKTLPDKYLSSTAVVCSECLKFFTSVLFHIVQRVREIKPPERYSFKILLDELFGKESDCIKIMVPAVLYLIQNNLQYYSASKLDAATYQVSYQMKIITTAIFSVIILKRSLFKHQWISIFMLAIGIALVQFPTGDSASKSSDNAMSDKIFGIISVVIACILSGVAGVYFEKILKKSKVTLWARNVQLSLFSIIPGYFIGVLLMDGETVKEKGFFGGYTRWTVLAILFQAFGGILVAVVVKYADNILKGFATSISIILSCTISYFAFDFNITLIFILGCSLVMCATYLYGKPVKQVETEVSYSRLENQTSLEDIEIHNIKN